MKKYGIPKSLICGRLPDFFHAAKPEGSLDIGTDLRNFVSENPQTRIVLWVNKESAIQNQQKITFVCKDLRMSRNKIGPKGRKFD